MRPRFVATLILVAAVVGQSAASAQDEFVEVNRDRGFQLLERIRRVLNERYYDSTFGGRNLDQLQGRAYGTIQNARSTAEVYGALADFVGGLGDSHTRFYPPETAVEVNYGWSWRMIGEDCLVSYIKNKSDAQAQGLQVGDKVLSLDGLKPTRESMPLIGYAYYSLRPKQGMRLYVEHPDGSRASVDFRSEVRRRASHIDFNDPDQRHSYVEEGGSGGPLYRWKVKDSVAVWKIGGFAYNDGRIDRYMEDARRHPWLIIDLRGNGGGAVEGLTRLLGHFWDEEFVALSEHWRDSTVEHHVNPRGKNGPYAGQVIVLVDSRSASAAEITSRVLQERGRATIVGDRTMGAVMASTGVSLEMQSNRDVIFYGMSLTVYDVVLPNGERLEGKGVIPNVTAIPTGADLAAGRDPAMQFAMEMAGVKMSAEEAAEIWK